jgi:hypothetical protein
VRVELETVKKVELPPELTPETPVLIPVQKALESDMIDLVESVLRGTL